MADQHDFSYKRINLARCIILMTVIIICIVFVSCLVSDNRQRYLQDAILPTFKYGFEVLELINVCVAFVYIRRKEKFHRKQYIFWPNRCCHCALVLRQEIRRADSEIQGNVESTNEEASYPESRDFTLHFVQGDARHHVDIPTRSLNSDHAPTETAEETFLLSSIPFAETNNICQHSCPGKRVHSQNRAMIKVFCVFCFASTLGLIVEIIRNFRCYAQDQYSATLIVSSTTLYAAIIVEFLIIIVFVEGFNDAVFLDSNKNLYFIALTIFLPLWKGTEYMFKPIGGLLESDQSYNETHNETIANHQFCYLNDTLGDIFRHDDHVMRPIYTELFFILIPIVLQMWNSFVPKTSITTYTSPLRSRACSIDLSFQWRKKFSFNFKRTLRRIRQLCFYTRREDEPLLSAAVSSPWFSKIFYEVWTLFLMSNLPYLGLCLYFIYDPNNFHTSVEFKIKDSFYEHAVLWSFETVFAISLCISLTYRNIKKKKLGNRSINRSGDSVLWKLKGHEIMLLVCSYGIFCQNIFLLIAAAGSLTTIHDLDAEKSVSCTIAVVRSMAKIIMVWQITGLLITIPRQTCDHSFDVLDKKRISVFIISVIVISGTQWLITSINNKSFPLERLYFGEKPGQVIGILLEPFETIFELHAAMMAYELYKEM